MTTSEDKGCSSKQAEKIMEYTFIVAAFAIFLFAMISTLASPHHEAPAEAGDGHVAAPPAVHH